MRQKQGREVFYAPEVFALSVEAVSTEGLTYGFFITLPHPHRGFAATPSVGALITSISHRQPAFWQTNRCPFNVLIAMSPPYVC